MSLLALVCDCGNVQPYIRSFLKSANHPSPMAVPLLAGRRAKDYATRYPSISAYLSRISSFAILVDEDGTDSPEWVDVNHASLDRRIKGQILVEQSLKS